MQEPARHLPGLVAPAPPTVRGQAARDAATRTCRRPPRCSRSTATATARPARVGLGAAAARDARVPAAHGRRPAARREPLPAGSAAAAPRASPPPPGAGVEGEGAVGGRRERDPHARRARHGRAMIATMMKLSRRGRRRARRRRPRRLGRRPPARRRRRGRQVPFGFGSGISNASPWLGDRVRPRPRRARRTPARALQRRATGGAGGPRTCRVLGDRQAELDELLAEPAALCCRSRCPCAARHRVGRRRVRARSPRSCARQARRDAEPPRPSSSRGRVRLNIFDFMVARGRPRSHLPTRAARGSRQRPSSGCTTRSTS